MVLAGGLCTCSTCCQQSHVACPACPVPRAATQQHTLHTTLPVATAADKACLLLLPLLLPPGLLLLLLLLLQGRLPLDLISCELVRAGLAEPNSSSSNPNAQHTAHTGSSSGNRSGGVVVGCSNLYSWGNGSNFTLGTGGWPHCMGLRICSGKRGWGGVGRAEQQQLQHEARVG